METGLAAQPLNWAAHVRVGVCTFVCHLYSILLLADVPTHWGKVQSKQKQTERDRGKRGSGTTEGGWSIEICWDSSTTPMWVIGHTVSSHPTSHTDSLCWRRGDDNGSHDQGEWKRHISVRQTARTQSASAVTVVALRSVPCWWRHGNLQMCPNTYGADSIILCRDLHFFWRSVADEI